MRQFGARSDREGVPGAGARRDAGPARPDRGAGRPRPARPAADGGRGGRPRGGHRVRAARQRQPATRCSRSTRSPAGPTSCGRTSPTWGCRSPATCATAAGSGPRDLQRQFLHAARLTLDRPLDGRRLTAWSELPADLAASLAASGIEQRPAADRRRRRVADTVEARRVERRCSRRTDPERQADRPSRTRCWSWCRGRRGWARARSWPSWRGATPGGPDRDRHHPRATRRGSSTRCTTTS